MSAPTDQIRTEVLDTARAIVTGDRQADYGDAAASFALIAQLWTATLGHEILPHEVALCLTQLKIARIAHNPTIRDSWVDGIGYLALGAEVAAA